MKIVIKHSDLHFVCRGAVVQNKRLSLSSARSHATSPKILF
jgi:hypothetical protein